MSAARPRAPALLRRATSRTRTARGPLPKLAALSVLGLPPVAFEALYAGLPNQPPESSHFPGHTAAPPFGDAALQVSARSKSPVAMVLLLVDLQTNQDLSRIELYGNPVLPPANSQGRPRYNFGLPQAVGLAVRESPFDLLDLHRSTQRGTFYGDLLGDWSLKWMSQDVRGLWGWTPVHLPATFGRFLLFAFGGLPEVPTDNSNAQRWGLDIQRLVVFPFPSALIAFAEPAHARWVA